MATTFGLVFRKYRYRNGGRRSPVLSRQETLDWAQMGIPPAYSAHVCVKFGIRDKRGAICITPEAMSQPEFDDAIDSLKRELEEIRWTGHRQFAKAEKDGQAFLAALNKGKI